MTEQFRDYAASIHCAFKEGEPLSAYTTFRIGGPSEMILFPSDGEMLRQLIAFCKEQNTVPFILGNGSNMLICDEGISGITISTARMQNCELLSSTRIRCDAGLTLSKLCMFAHTNSLTGLEFAYGIPGSVGGAVFMNAGAYGGEMKDVLLSCETIDENGDVHTFSLADMKLGYRSSVFQNSGYTISSVTVDLKEGDKVDIRLLMDDILQKRKDKQPLNYPSAGSAFKRPEGHFAGALIEQCGLKGFSIGGAQVSEKHAGFIVNTGGASARDVTQLIDYIRRTVLRKTGVMLEPEIRLISR